jgi:RNA polymerase sigma factor (sigma-70 family)
MSAQSDASLLRDWTIGGSEEAFAELARRYAGLLYHAALRRTGREDLAGESAQNSLLILARKAPQLTDLPTLAGWLHRTACYEAAKILRRERRHEARMKNLPPPDGPDDDDSPWQEAAPLLDRALDALPEKDRQVIFLKYFDGMSFEQMAKQFGGESAAWRQRGSRAVEKLRVSLAKRGVAVSCSTLAMGLGTTLSEAAPASVVATLSASPVAGAAGLSWTSLALHSLHLMKIKPSIALAAVLLLSLLPLGLQTVALANAKMRVGLLEGEVASKAAARSSPVTTVSAGPNTRSKLDVAMLAHAFMAPYHGDFISYDAAEWKLGTIGVEELESLIGATAEEPLTPEARLNLMSALFARYCELAEESGMPFGRFAATATLAAKSSRAFYRRDLWTRSKGIVDRWMREDPDAAIAWYRESLASGVLGSPSPGEWTGTVFRVLHEKDPADALEFYRSLPDPDRAAVINGNGVSSNPVLAIELATTIEDPGSRMKALQDAFMRSETATAEEVRDWLAPLQLSDESAVRLLVDAARGMRRELSREDIAGRLAWLREAGVGHDLSQATAFYFVKASSLQFREAFDDEWKRSPDEKMLAAYVAGVVYAGEGTKTHAFEMSKHFKDPVLRDQSLKRMLLLPGQDPADTRKYAEKIGMSLEEIERLLPVTP